MHKFCRNQAQRGFSLVEMLIAMVVFGLLATAIYQVLFSVQRTTTDTTQVGEVQQDLRLTVEQMAIDLRHAGFLAAPPAVTLAQSQRLTLVSAAGEATVRLGEDALVPAGLAETTLVAADSGALGALAGGDVLRLLRPGSLEEPLGGVLTVKQVDGDEVVLALSPLGLPVQVLSGDLLVRLPAGSPALPYAVDYALQPDGSGGWQVVRTAAGLSEGLASGLESISFGYLLTDGSELTTVAGDQRSRIVAVRLRLTAAARSVVGADRVREVETIVRLRNVL